MTLPTAHSIIRHNCTFRRAPWVAAAVATLAVGVLAIAGCSSGTNGKAAGKSTEAASAESKAVTKALDLAATVSARVNSLTTKLTVRSSDPGAGNLTGTVDIQLKPKTVIKAVFNIVASKSPAIQLDEILTGNAVYFKDPSFTKAAGKPWVEADITQLSSKVGVSLGSLLQNLESSNPLDQTKLFTASRNARMIGSSIIRGVPTVEYAGTYEPAVALAGLSSKASKLLGPTLRSIGPNPVQFEVWIDANHIVRQAQDTANVHGQLVTTNLIVTSVNEPVHVALPAPSEVAPLPKI
jgi:hypothetical protein